MRLGTNETTTQMKTTAQAKDEGSLFRNGYPESVLRNRKEASFEGHGEVFWHSFRVLGCVLGLILVSWRRFLELCRFGLFLGKVLGVILLSWRAFGVTSGELGAPDRPKLIKDRL